MQLAPARTELPDLPHQVTFYRALEQRLAQLPSTDVAAVVSYLPLRGGQLGRLAFINDGTVPPLGREPRAFPQAVSAGYARALRIPLRAGRFISDREAWETGGVAVVTQLFVDRYLPGQEPLGQRVSLRDPRQGAARCLTIVGVTGDVRVRARGLEASPDPGI
jgi:hypothetical protein